MAAPYVDIHSHSLQKTRHIKIVSIFLGENVTEIEQCMCVGIHPWHSDISIDDLEPKFAPYVERMVALGEIGLDRTILIPLKKQQEIFEAQLDIAQKHQLPVIIHCVKAYTDVLATIRRYNGLTYIFHGFYANETILKNLQKYNCYFSVGLRELQRTSGTTLIKQIPLDRLFLETDDSNMDIEAVYMAASKATNINLFEMKELLYNNYTHLF